MKTILIIILYCLSTFFYVVKSDLETTYSDQCAIYYISKNNNCENRECFMFRYTKVDTILYMGLILDYPESDHLEVLPECINLLITVKIDVRKSNIGGPLRPLRVDRILYFYPYIDLSYNKFEGSIPSNFIELNPHYVEHLDLSHNNLEGNLPSDLFDKMKDIRVLKLNNNQFTGMIPESIYNDMNSLEILDLSNNKFTGCPKIVKSSNPNFYCDLRGNNFDEECDFSNLNCLIDKKEIIDINEGENECKINSECQIRNVVDKEIISNGVLKIYNDIEIKDFKVGENNPLIKIGNTGMVILHDTNIKIKINDNIVNSIKNGNISPLIKIIEGKNDGNISSIDLIHDKGKCTPFHSSVQRDIDMSLYVNLLYDNQKCSKSNTEFIILYITLGIIGTIIISFIIIILLVKYNTSFRNKIFPYEKRKKQFQDV